jgi:hypothetical protein
MPSLSGRFLYLRLHRAACHGGLRPALPVPLVNALAHDEERRHEQHRDAGGGEHAAEYRNAD